MISIMLVLVLWVLSCKQGHSPQWPGTTSDGTVLLPNHYRLTPAGEQIPVGDLPLNMTVSPDGKYLAVTNNGYSEQFISIIDIKQQKQVQTLPVQASFFGLDFSRDGQMLYASGGGRNLIYFFSLRKGQFVQTDSMYVNPGSSDEWFVTGLTAGRDGKFLYVATKTARKLLKISVSDKQIVKSLSFDHFLYDVVMTQDGKKLYVSIWGGKAVAVVDPYDLTLIGTIPAGDHPNKMVLADDGRLFVANANTDDVSAIDTKSDRVIETISVRPYPGARYGSTPNGLAVTSDGKTLFVVNAGNNDVAVLDISVPGSSRVKGLIPAGWYPTAAALAGDGKTLFIANGKGLRSKPNPRAPQPVDKDAKKSQYIGRLLWGTVSVLPVPDDKQLMEFTVQVRKNNDWEKMSQNKKKDTRPHAIPLPGGTSPIKHVIYIIKENRTYDQVLGDMAQGNGDTSLVLFGRKITPNHHKIAEQFILFDNFYVDAEVSADGHEWSTAAVATDFVEKTWPATYSGRGKGYPSEGNYPIASPAIGYLWDMAARAGISYRSYAEFIKIGHDSSGTYYYTPMDKLKGHFDPRFRPWDLNYPDTLRAAEFIREMHEYEKKGNWPNLMIMRLPNDHTYGTALHKHTPRSMVAENDLALGMVFDAVSHSKFWKETALFVLEDDAQNGPDHVDAHRSILLIASPYAKRGWTDHNMYSTTSVLRTIELILGLEPMSQFDAAAFPLTTAFTDKPDLTPYDYLRNTWPMDRMNTDDTYGSKLSMLMDWDEEDEAPEQPLNEILWKSIKGEHSPMPEIRDSRYRQLFNPVGAIAISEKSPMANRP